MDNRVKKEWIKALKSGKYQQGTGRLRKNDDYCCLGVLCELAVREGVVTSAVQRIDTNGTVYKYGVETGFLPPSVLLWSGIGDKDPFVRDHDGTITSLSSLNDSQNFSFKEIAEIIDKSL